MWTRFCFVYACVSWAYTWAWAFFRAESSDLSHMGVYRAWALFRYGSYYGRIRYSWKEIACNAHFGSQDSFSAEYSETDTLQCLQLLIEKWEFKRQSSSKHNFVEPCGGLVAGITQPQSRPHHSSTLIRNCDPDMARHSDVSSSTIFRFMALQLIRLVTT